VTQDSLQRFIFDNADIRGAYVTMGSSCEALFEHQDYAMGQRELLAEFSAAAVLLMGHLKFEGTIALQAKGGAQIDLMVAECNQALEFRATMRASAELVQENIQESLGGGILAMTLTPNHGSPYQGIVPLGADSLAQCLGDYFEQSEQLPTWFFLASNGKQAAAMMLQAMPAQVCVDAEEAAEHWSRVVQLASTLRDEEALNLEASDVLYRLFHEEQVRLFDPQSICFKCTCSLERMERGLLTLGAKELTELANEQESVSTQCHFCGAEYHFSRGEMLRLLQSVGAGFEH